MKMKLKLTLAITTVFVLSVSVVIGLVALSKDIREQPGSFLRQYPPHPIVESKIIKLPNERYYIAGATSRRVYLANRTTPFRLLEIDATTGDTSTVNLTLVGGEKLKYYRIIVRVDSPYFYVMDGSIPYIYRGDMVNWKGESVLHDSTYFIDALPISGNSFGIRAMSSKTQEHALGKVNFTGDVKLNYALLQKQFDGVFCTDGLLSYNKASNRFIYMYFYRNQYMVMDTAMNLLYRGNTIDTFTVANVKSAWISSGKALTLSAPPVVTNRTYFAYKHWLFVQSLLPAKNEFMDYFNKASVIDLYDLNDQSYQFSFYIFDLFGEKLTAFIIADDKLFALFEHSVMQYDLADRFFNEMEIRE